MDEREGHANGDETPPAAADDGEPASLEALVQQSDPMEGGADPTRPAGEAAAAWSRAAPGEGTGDGVRIGGGLVAATAICRRQVWLMAHAIRPDEDDPHLVYGRFLHQQAYGRQRKEAQLGDNRLDLVQGAGDELIVLEVKKSDRAAESARLQLAHYLLSLEEAGIAARGELRFPEQRRAEPLELTPALRDTVRTARERAQSIATAPTPPPAERNRWCSHCAYAEFCWA